MTIVTKQPGPAVRPASAGLEARTLSGRHRYPTDRLVTVATRYRQVSCPATPRRPTGSMLNSGLNPRVLVVAKTGLTKPAQSCCMDV